MNFSTEERSYNLKTNTEFKKFDDKEVEKEVYALTLDELMKIYNYHFTNDAYSQVRDVFCFLCFTGLRFSDAEKLKREDIKNDSIHLLIRKTKTPMVIPLNSYAQKILKKYENEPKPLPIISNQKTNEHLYEMGKLLKINVPVKRTIFKGAEVIETYVPKCEVLTTHLGRKTFITNSLILGMSERAVKEFSGHKKDVNFRKYVSFADTFKDKVMNTVWNEKSIKKAQK